jgi:hypothetical protein
MLVVPIQLQSAVSADYLCMHILGTLQSSRYMLTLVDTQGSVKHRITTENDYVIAGILSNAIVYGNSC